MFIKTSVENLIVKISEIKDMESKLKAKRKELEAEVFANLEKPEEKNSTYLNVGDLTAILQWKSEIKISQSDSRKINEQYPELSRRLFSVSYKPKISYIQKLELLNESDDTRGFKKQLNDVKQFMVTEEKQVLTFKKEVESDE